MERGWAGEAGGGVSWDFFDNMQLPLSWHARTVLEGEKRQPGGPWAGGELNVDGPD